MFRIGQTVTRNGRYYRITSHFATATDIHTGWEVTVEHNAGYTRCRHPGNEARVTCAACGRTRPVSRMYPFRRISDENQRPPMNPPGVIGDPSFEWACRDQDACSAAAAAAATPSAATDTPSAP